MPIFTLAEVEEQIAAWKLALLKVSKKQEHVIHGRRWTFADVAEIRETLKMLGLEKSKIEAVAAGKTTGPQCVSFIPVYARSGPSPN